MREGKVKKHFYKKWWVWVIGIIVVIGIANAGGNKNTSTSVSKPNIQLAKQDEIASKPIKPEITITATELAKAFDENEIKGKQLYKGKLAKISGKVSDIGEILGSTYIVLKNEKSDFEIVSVQCFFKDKVEIDKIGKINKGDKVIIIGEIDGKSMNVGVNNCRFEK